MDFSSCLGPAACAGGCPSECATAASIECPPALRPTPACCVDTLLDNLALFGVQRTDALPAADVARLSWCMLVLLGVAADEKEAAAAAAAVELVLSACPCCRAINSARDACPGCFLLGTQEVGCPATAGEAGAFSAGAGKL